MKKLLIITLAVITLLFGIYYLNSKKVNIAEAPIVPTTPSPIIVEPEPVVPIVEEPVLEENNTEIEFKEIILTSDRPGYELTQIVGKKNVWTALAINRIDDKNLTIGMTLIVPISFDDPSIWEFMPDNIANAITIPKLIIVSQRTQAFGFYENGKLVRSGPVSTGKKTTQTPSGLYFTNWKGKEVISTFSDEWTLKWNFNIENNMGISLHEYALPGFPASHSCVRMYERDAMWLYDWANTWILSSNGQTKLANGTPVIIYGNYDFNNIAPWKRLIKEPNATKVTQTEIENVLNDNLVKIEVEQALRGQVLK